MLRILKQYYSQRYFSLLQPSKLQKRNWKQDLVYLFQCKQSSIVPTLSPFCIKLETFLRANNIKYKIKAVKSWTLFSKEERVPFIELNGEHISDSQIILWRLINHFNINEKLSSEQEGVARAIDRMLEGSTYYAVTYFRSFENAENLAKVNELTLLNFLTSFVAKKLRKTTEICLRNNGIALHSRENIIEILRRDVKALDQILGEKKFLMGVRPTIPDFSLYGHLSIGYYLPFNQPITNLLNNDFPRVRLLIERIHAHYWSN